MGGCVCGRPPTPVSFSLDLSPAPPFFPFLPSPSLPPPLPPSQGDTSPQGDPELYCAAVRSLYSWYLHSAADPLTGLWPPLVVNTHGWVKGVGLDVLAEVLLAVAPSHVLQVGRRRGRGMKGEEQWFQEERRGGGVRERRRKRCEGEEEEEV